MACKSRGTVAQVQGTTVEFTLVPRSVLFRTVNTQYTCSRAEGILKVFMRRLCNPLHFVYVMTCISIQVYFNIDISPLVLYLFFWTGNFFSTDSISTAFSCLSLLGLTEHKLYHSASLLLDTDKKNVWWVWTLTSSQLPEGIAWKCYSWGKPPTVRFQKKKHSLTFQFTSFMQTTQRWLYILRESVIYPNWPGTSDLLVSGTECWDCKHAPSCLLYEMLGIEPEALGMLCKSSTH